MQIYNQALALTFTGIPAYAAIIIIVILLVLWITGFLANQSLEHENCSLIAAVSEENEALRRRGVNVVEACARIGIDGPVPRWIVATMLSSTAGRLDSAQFSAILLGVLEEHELEQQGKSHYILEKEDTRRLLGLLEGLFDDMADGTHSRRPRLAKPVFAEITHRLGYIRDLLDEESPDRAGYPRLDPRKVLPALEEILSKRSARVWATTPPPTQPQ